MVVARMLAGELYGSIGEVDLAKIRRWMADIVIWNSNHITNSRVCQTIPWSGVSHIDPLYSQYSKTIPYQSEICRG